LTSSLSMTSAEGASAEVMESDEVKKAYLGSEE
jgi:ABC-type lipopolysaccharide export system ATPase subunit